MHILISYDISSNQTRRFIFEKLREYGINTQRSIFECEIDHKMLKEILCLLQSVINTKTDSVLIQPLCKRCTKKVRISGQGIKLGNYNFEVI